MSINLHIELFSEAECAILSKECLANAGYGEYISGRQTQDIHSEVFEALVIPRLEGLMFPYHQVVQAPMINRYTEDHHLTWHQDNTTSGDMFFLTCVQVENPDDVLRFGRQSPDVVNNPRESEFDFRLKAGDTVQWFKTDEERYRLHYNGDFSEGRITIATRFRRIH